ncbi:MAG: CatA-like O-acetyltransferase [Saprospiraceae bacterium]
MKKIELTDPHRKKHFEFFSRMDQPHLSICANVEIQHLLAFIKKEKLSFTPTLVYLVTRVANELPRFRQRIRATEVVEHELVHPSFTVATADEEVFSFCTVDYTRSFHPFQKRARAEMEAMRTAPSMADESGRDDYLFLSAIPWISFTGVQHAMHYHPGDSVPRIVWGKYFVAQDLIKMPLSVQAHHAVVDGVHIGRYFQKFQKYAHEPHLLLSE